MVPDELNKGRVIPDRGAQGYYTLNQSFQSRGFGWSAGIGQLGRLKT